MPKYLRTSAISASLEELIRDAREKLYIISPYLKLSDNIKELLNDKEKDKVDVRIIFGKQELIPSEMSFLQGFKYVKLYFSKNLHAKCYLNEKKMIISSMNLYEFSQQNNREMGILIEREIESDAPVYSDAWRDIESILNNSIDFSYIEAPRVNNGSTSTQTISPTNTPEITSPRQVPFKGKFLSATALSKALGISSKDLQSKIEKLRWIEKDKDQWVLTNLGKSQGAELKKGQYGDYIAYPETVIEDLS